MINEENLNKLYNGILEQKYLTTKELKKFGFNSKDLNKLIENGTINRIKRGIYSFKNVNELYSYGKQLIGKKEYQKATECFEACFELDDTHLGTCFQLFLRSIENKDYKKAFQYYDKLKNTKNIYYKQDTNYYLYLLSLITEMPEKYQEEIKKMNFNDIKVLENDLRYEDIKEQNKIRMAAFQRKLPYALHQLNISIVKQKKYSVQSIISKNLLTQTIEKETINRNTIINLLKEKKYDELINYIQLVQEKCRLTVQEKYILKLSKQYKKIKETLEIPAIADIEVTGILEAIDACNFEYALELSEKYDEKSNVYSENPFRIVLNDICGLIKTIEENKTESINYQSIASYLINNDIEKALKNLKIYIKNINKEEYEFIVENLIKLSILEQDPAYTKPIIALTQLANDKYVIDIHKYIKDFYMYISQQKYEQARVHLDIITTASKIQNNAITVDNLRQILELSKNIIKDKTIEKPEEKVEIIEIEKTKNPSENKTEHQEPLEEEKYILRKYNQIKTDGIVILKRVNKERVDKIFEELDKYNDILGFVINSETKEQIVLRYYNPTPELIKNEKKLLEEAKQLYKNGNYKECIKKYYEVIKVLPTVNSTIFVHIGLSYMKIFDIKKAIDFLTIAKELAKKENIDRDLSELILRLKGEIKKEDCKPRVNINEKEFEDKDPYYGIKNFIEINKYIHLSGFDVETACQNLGKTQEQTDIIKLIYAKQYYTQGDFEKGDQFIKSVENSKEKTDKVIKLLDQIRTNKKFYQNRDPEYNIQYSLKIMPKGNN